MNLTLRLLWLLAAAPFRTRLSALEIAITKWRVLPTDLDAFGHMNNARYLAVMDLARLDLLVRLGVAPLILRHRWQVPVVSSSMTYRAPLLLLQDYEVATRIVSWDAAWIYLRQDFLRPGQTAPVATGYVKLCVRGSVGPLAAEELWAMLGQRWPRPELPREFARRLGATGNDGLADLHGTDGAPAPTAPVVMTDVAGAREPLAICGVGCRLPGGIEEPGELWRALRERRDGIVEIGADRWDPERFFDHWFDGSVVEENPLLLPFVKWLRDRRHAPTTTPKRLKIVLVNLNLRLGDSELVASLVRGGSGARLAGRAFDMLDLLLDSKTQALVRTLAEVDGVEVMTATLDLGRMSFITRKNLPHTIRSGQIMEAWKLDLYRGSGAYA